MAIVECDNGHLYDNVLHNACPYCNGGIYRVDFGAAPEDIGSTVLLDDEPADAPELQGFSYAVEPDDGIGRTVLLDEEQEGYLEDIGKTVLLDEEPEQDPEDTGKTVLLDEDVSFAGRLLCTEGPDKGRTIILEPGKNIDISGGSYVFLP